MLNSSTAGQDGYVVPKTTIATDVVVATVPNNSSFTVFCSTDGSKGQAFGRVTALQVGAIN